MHAKSCPHTLAESSEPAADPYIEAMRLVVDERLSRRAAADRAGLKCHKTLYNRLERYRAAHGLPPLPDARRGPRASRVSA